MSSFVIFAQSSFNTIVYKKIDIDANYEKVHHFDTIQCYLRAVDMDEKLFVGVEKYEAKFNLWYNGGVKFDTVQQLDFFDLSVGLNGHLISSIDVKDGNCVFSAYKGDIIYYSMNETRSMVI